MSSEKTQSSTLDEAYEDRNLLILTLAVTANEKGWEWGIRRDIEAPDWWVVMFNIPAYGQVSYHLPEELLDRLGPTARVPQYHQEWDGHGLAEKRRRLWSYIRDGFRQ